MTVRKNLTRIILLPLVLLFPAASYSAFYNIQDATVPSLPSGWTSTGWLSKTVASENTVQPTRGSRVLSTQLPIPSGAWLLTPSITAVTNAVVDFSYRYLDSSSVATLKVSRVSGGATNIVGRVELVPSPSVWRRGTLFPDPAFAIGSSGQFLFEFEGVSTNETVELDNLYFGRGLVREEGLISYDYTAGTGIPSMWHTWGTVTWLEGTSSLGGRSGPFFQALTGNISASQTGLISPFAAIPAPPSGNFVVQFDLYNQSGGNMDTVQFAVSTNDWASFTSIGAQVPRYDSSFAENQWRTVEVSSFVAGLGGNASVRVGLIVRAGGLSSRSVYVDRLRVRTLTSVLPSGMRYSGWDSDTGTLSDWSATAWGATFNDDPYISISLEPRPPEDVTNVVATLYHIRGTNAPISTVLEQVGSSDAYRTAASLGPFEAGETNQYRVEVTFGSKSGMETNSPVFYPGLSSNVWQETVIGGRGSVWVNELSSGWVELSAPEGRTIPADALAGWTLRLIGGEQIGEYALAGVTFTNAVHMGFAFADQDLDPPLSGDLLSGTAYLINGAGIAEFSVAYDVSDGGAWSAFGNGPYVGDGDYTQYGENFSWQATSGTRGALNELQGFEVPVSTYARITGTVAFASTAITAEFTGGNDSKSSLADVNGDTSAGSFSGMHTNASAATASISGTAFGWVAQPSQVSMLLGSVTNTYSLPMTPGVGEDSFASGTPAGYWEATGSSPVWLRDAGTWTVLTGNQPQNTTSRQRVRNVIESRTKRHVSISLLTRNTNPSGNVDEIIPTFNTNATWGVGTQITLPSALNRYAGFATNADVPYRAVQPLSAVGAAEQFWFALRARAGGLSGRSLILKDLRLAFQDMVTAGDLQLLPAAPRAGDELGISVDLEPWGDAVADVTAALVYRVNGGVWQTNANLVLMPLTLSNTTTVVLSPAMGPFAEGDMLEYYVSVTYDPDDGDPSTTHETRYAPDNSTLDNGAWLTIGAYGPQPVSVQVLGVGNVWFNEIAPNPEGDAASHFIELAGVEGIDLTGWTVQIEDLTNALASQSYTLSGNLTAGATNGFAFYVLGGAGVTERQQALTNALPRAGGLTLRDAGNAVRYAISYDAGAAGAATNAPAYTYIGAAGGETLIATGDGNPANQQFAWATTTVPTPGAVNPSQNMLNRGPSPNPAELEAFSPGEIGVTSITARAVQSITLNPPAEYRLWIEGGADSGWSTNRFYTFTGLSENTAYSFRTQSRDSLGVSNTVSDAVTVYTLLDTPSAPALHSPSPTELTAELTVPNLGEGDTAIRFGGTAGDSGWITNNSWTATGLLPNASYDAFAWARNGDGVETQAGPTNSLYTLAFAPTVAPLLEKDVGTLFVSVTNAYDVATGIPVDGNPAGTEYAIGTFGEDGETNYLAAAGTVTNMPVWQALPDWHAPDTSLVAKTSITETNWFFLVARNGDGFMTAAGPDAYVVFELAVAAVAADHRGDGQGHIEAILDVFNPWTNDVLAGLEYSTNGASGPWAAPTLLSAQSAYGGMPTLDPAFETNGVVYQVQNITTAPDGTNVLAVVWHAGEDLDPVVYSNVWLRWQALDPVGGPPAAPSLFEIGLLDLKPPTPALSTTALDPTNLAEISFAVDFGEAVTGFEASDITVVNGAVTNFALVSGTNYTFGVVADTDGAVTVSLAAGVAADLAGNPSEASNLIELTYDGTAPVSVLTTTALDPTNLSEIPFAVDFGEAVTGFEASGITVVNGVLTNFVAWSSTNYTFGVIADADGLVTVSVEAAADGTAPVPVLTTSAPDPTNLSEISFAVDFGEAVTGFEASDITVVNGVVTNLAMESSTNYTFGVIATVQPPCPYSPRAHRIRRTFQRSRLRWTSARR